MKAISATVLRKICSFLSIAVFIQLQYGCGPDDSIDTSVISSSAAAQLVSRDVCDAPKNQKASFLAPLPSTPVKLLLDETFTTSERNKIMMAAYEWNINTKILVGHAVFQVDTFQAGDLTSYIQAGKFSCSLSEPSLGPTVIPVFRETGYKAWTSLGLTETTPAVTLRCYENSVGTLKYQTIAINVDISNSGQLQSIILHELGHAIGLDHSCRNEEPSDDWTDEQKQQYRNQFISCAEIDEGSEYYNAVMYPSLKLGTGVDGNINLQTKESLTANDQTRARCILE